MRSENCDFIAQWLKYLAEMQQAMPSTFTESWVTQTGNGFSQEDRVSSSAEGRVLLVDKENLDSKSAPNTNWVEWGIPAQLRSLWRRALTPQQGCLFSFWILFWNCGLGNRWWKQGPPPHSLRPYPGTDYLLDKPSCLPLQVLTSLLGSQGRTTCSDTEISGRPWGAIVVKLQRSAERMKTSKISFV